MIEQDQLNDMLILSGIDEENIKAVSECIKMVTVRIGIPIMEAAEIIIKMMNVFIENSEKAFKNEESNAANFLSEKEIKKRIRYSKTPMESKYWNKILNEKKRRK